MSEISDKELVDYQKVDLALLPAMPSSEQGIFEAFPKSIDWNGDIELVGTPPSFESGLMFFLLLRRKASEVILTNDTDETAALLFTIRDTEESIRPKRVKIISWSLEEASNDSSDSGGQYTQDGVLALDRLWQQIVEQKSVNPGEQFLGRSAVISEKMLNVHLRGAIPLDLACLLLDYLIAMKEEVTWNDILFKK